MPKAIILNSSQYESICNCPDPAWDTCEYDGGGCSDTPPPPPPCDHLPE